MPGLIRIVSKDLAEESFGCDQEWYAEHWQRQAGCGPCTAATLLYYLSRRRQGFDRSLFGRIP